MLAERFHRRFLAVAPFALAFALCALPAAVHAQDSSATATAPVPSYAHPAAPSDEETIHGRIQSIDGKYGLSVRDDRGFVDNVQMHDGTIINPTGLMLRPGMSVTIMGYNRGRVFDANEIDTPYENVSYGYGYGPYPYPVYPYPVYPYPAPGFLFEPRFGFHWH